MSLFSLLSSLTWKKNISNLQVANEYLGQIHKNKGKNSKDKNAILGEIFTTHKEKYKFQTNSTRKWMRADIKLL